MLFRIGSQPPRIGQLREAHIRRRYERRRREGRLSLPPASRAPLRPRGRAAEADSWQSQYASSNDWRRVQSLYENAVPPAAIHQCARKSCLAPRELPPIVGPAQSPFLPSLASPPSL